MKERRAKRLTQGQLAAIVWPGDSNAAEARKGDISKIETGKVANPHATTVAKIAEALRIPLGDIDELRRLSQLAGHEQLNNIPTLSREALENLAARFEIKGVYDKGEDELRGLLTDKADEYRDLRRQIAALDETIAEVAELKHKAETAAADYNFEEVENLLAAADFAETTIGAKTKITRANNALLRGRTEQAYNILSAVADSYGSSDPTVPVQMRLELAQILYHHGLRYGSDGMTWSEQMFRVALATAEQLKYRYAIGAAHNGLAITLQEQGIRIEGTKGADLLAQAVTAYRAALEVYTRDAHPVDWAKTHNNLGNALQHHGIRSKGTKGADLLAQAVSAYHAVLEVHTRDAHPVDWAMMQNNLGSALQNQGTRTEGTRGADLLAQAVTAYRAALEVRTRDAHPVEWAATQNNLGNALGDQGTRTEGTKGADHLAQADTAYRVALEVHTREAHPVHWAMIQESIAITHLETADHDSCGDPTAELTKALEAVDAALTIFDPVHMSYQHTAATNLRDKILARLKP